MVAIVSLVKNGYFPRELPPPFTTDPLGNLVAAKLPSFPDDFDGSTGPNFRSRAAIHNLTRVGSLRRKLSIPNPVNYILLSKRISADWLAMYAHCVTSTYSLSRPDLTNTSGRAVGREHPLSSVPDSRARLRARSRYVLKTDISLFYPTIYTHSIPWALNGKTAAKAAIGTPALIGNEIDRFVRDGQEGQTMGIPIGPDTSLVIAESILTAADRDFQAATAANGFRYMDDYEFGFSNYADAEHALAVLQGVLNNYELQLNPNKTQIVDMPEPIEPLWVSELRVFPFRSGPKDQRYDLTWYFNRAFELSKANKTDYVLKYALSRLASESIDAVNWELYQHLLLQTVSAEPGTLPFALDELKFYVDLGFPLDSLAVSAVLSEIISVNSPLGHGSDVAWALWGSILLNLPVDSGAANRVVNVADPVVALLALDANSTGLLGAGFSSTLWEALMTTAELRGDQWLLAYEANVKGWLPSVGGVDNLVGEPAFQFLKSESVYFYDPSLTAAYRPRRTRLVDYASGASTVSHV